jgi:ABC-2 type transport system permease protein
MVHYTRMFLSSLSVEIRQKLTYRFDLLLELAVTLFARAFLGFLIWSAIFEQNNLTELNGLSLSDLMVYYLLAALVDSFTSFRMGFIADEVYAGRLTKFLIIPMPFGLFKFAAAIAENLVPLIQIVLVYCIVWPILGAELSTPLEASSLLIGLGACCCAFLLNFALHMTIELCSFWVDKVWSLLIMVHLTAQFLGGLLLPLEAFPSWAQATLKLLPFYYLVGFPVNALMGRLTTTDYLSGIAIALCWALTIAFVARSVWRRGIVQYGAVGI